MSEPETDLIEAIRNGLPPGVQRNLRGLDPDAAWVSAAIMSAVATRRLIVELEASTLPRGRVIVGDGRGISFTGWVELAAAIEQARGVPAQPRGVSGGDAGPPGLRGTLPPE